MRNYKYFIRTLVRKWILLILSFTLFLLPSSFYPTLLGLGPGSFVDIFITGIFDDGNEIVTTINDQPYGTKIGLDDSVSMIEGYNFVYWVINGIVRQDLAIDEEFTITNHMDIQAVFRPTSQWVVLFVDINGTFIDAQYVDMTGVDSVDDPSTIGVTLPSRPGLAYNSVLWKTKEGITSLTNISDNRVYILQYESSGSSDMYTLSVDGENRGLYKFNEVVSVTTDSSRSGQLFSHWEEQGHTVSYLATYTFTMLSDRTLIPIFDSLGYVTPLVSMSNDLSIREGYRTYLGQFDLPESFTLVEHGFLFSTSEDYVTFNSPEVTVAQSHVYHPTTHEFVMSIPDNNHTNVRAYIVYQTSNQDLVTIYSDNNPRYIHEATYSTGFEDDSKESYDLENVTLNTVEWAFDNSVIGTLENDKKNDLKSARLSGQIYTLTGFTNLGEIQFNAAKYGTGSANTLRVFVSKNGTDWVEVSDVISDSGIAVTSTQLTLYKINLYGSLNYQQEGFSTLDALQVKFSVDNPNTSYQVNIDDVVICAKMSFYEDVNRVNDDIDSIDLESRYTMDTTVELPNEGPNGSRITWTSSHPDYISTLGEVTAPVGTEIEVTLTASVKYGVASIDETYVIKVGILTSELASDLLITEYVEGSEFNKAIEIFNATGAPADLYSYSVKLYVNGASYEMTKLIIDSSRTATRYLQHGETLVIYYGANTSDAFKTKGDIRFNHSVVNFNGDDALELLHNGVIIDSIGQVGVDPGIAWNVNEVSTLDKTLVRLSSVRTGRANSRDPFDPSDEWVAYPMDTSTYFGTHTFTPGTTAPLASNQVSISPIPIYLIEMKDYYKLGAKTFKFN